MRLTLLPLITAACLLSTSLSVFGAEPCKPRDANRPAVGLVLGGGGARGSAHVGVIQRLEELRIPVDCVVGTSMGALVGAMYATGMSGAELEAVIADLDWGLIFNDNTPRKRLPFRRKRDDTFALFGPKIGIGEDSSSIPTGALSGQRLSFLFESLVSERTSESRFRNLPIPFQAVATDIVTGEAVVMDTGNLASSMRASMSVPGLFNPVRRDGRLLVDGGLVDMLPVRVAQNMGADVIIAVDVGSEVLEEEDIRNLLGVVAQLFNIMIESNVAASLELLTDDDLLIVPPLPEDFGAADFTSTRDGIGIGYDGASGLDAELGRFALSESAYAAYLASRPAVAANAPVVEFVRLDNGSRFSDDLILRRLDVTEGAPLDADHLEAGIEEVYGLGFLELVTYRVVEEDGQQGIEIKVEEDSRGTALVESGLDLFSDGINDGFNLRLGYLRTDIDDLGSEMRVFGQVGRDPAIILDLWKYLDADSRWFVAPQLYAFRSRGTIFEDDNARAVVDLDTYGGGAAFGRELSRFAVVNAGARAYSGQVDPRIGPADASSSSFDAVEGFVGATFDRLDNLYFPSDGSFARLDYIYSDQSFGADSDYQQLLFRGLSARTFGDHTVFGFIDVSATVAGVSPIYAAPRAGGLFRLTGNYDNQLGGQNAGVVTGSYQYRLGEGRLMPSRIGMSLEYGGVADRERDLFRDGEFHGSLFLAYRSPIGPAYIGAGFGEDGQRRFFVRFGSIFSPVNAIR